MRLSLHSLSCAVGALAALSAAQDIVLFDFEGPDALQGWKNDGGAFAVSPKNAPYYGRIPIENVHGGQFLYSFDTQGRTNTPVGTLTSPEFTIERNYINFILGGGRGWPERLGAQLVVGGKVVRSSTGRESRPAVSFKMLPLNWDVRDFKGKRAHIVFNDQTPYGTLGADYFVQSDIPQGFRSDATERFNETYRPVFHATAGRGRLGDANGMFYLNGQWHLGYQLYYVDAGGTGWGHAVSDDLVHWTTRGEMIPVGLTGIAFSGGAAVDWNNTSGLKKGDQPPVLLFYTLLPPGAGTAFPDTPFSKVAKADDIRFFPAIAYSTDGGDTFTKTTEPLLQYGNPQRLTYEKGRKYTLDGGKTWVDDPGALLGSGGFKNDRDSKAFYYAPGKEWILIWHLSQNNNREKTAFGLYRSKDLKKWELFQTIPGMWECPDFFELPAFGKDDKPTGQRYWIMSRGGVEYFVGTFDGNEFKPIPLNAQPPYKPVAFDDPAYDAKKFLHRVNFKSGCYAAQIFANAPDGRAIQVSWLSEGKTADHSPGSPFECVLSFPVELTLRDTGNGLVLEHVPVKEIEAIYAQTHTLSNVILAEGLTKDPLPLKTALLDIDVVFEAGTAKTFGLSVLGENIRYAVKEQKLYAFRDYDAGKKATVTKSTFVPLEDGKICLRILVDRSSIEVGINHGVYRTTQLVYPQDDLPRLSFISEGGQAKIVSLRVSELKASQAKVNGPGLYREK